MLLHMLQANPAMVVATIAIFIASITLHEFGHAATAHALGDPTPDAAGRVTLNPASHLSFFGTLFLLLAGFGWAKPVPVTPSKLRWPRFGNFLVSAMGPMTNFLLALIALLALAHFPTLPEGSQMWLMVMFRLNVTLMVLNLLPIPPLDGGHLIEALVPRRWLHHYEQLMPYGIVLLLVLVFWPFSASPLGRLFNAAQDLMIAVFT